MSPSEAGPRDISFGHLLRQLRLTAALTQEELAEVAGLSAKTVGNLERGQGRPYRRSVRLLADALKLAGAAREEFMAAPAGQHDQDQDRTLRPSEQSGVVVLQVPPAAHSGGAGSAPRAAARGQVSPIQPVPELVSRKPWPVSVLPVARGAAATRTLPRDTVGFTGRRSELARLTLTAAHAGGVVGIQAIGGMAGVGKTALAVHAAHQLASRFPDGQLFVPLHGHTPGYRPADPADALAGLLVTAGVSPARIPSGLPERVALWRDHLAGQRVLLVLDDAASSEQVEPLLPGTAGSLVLVTSRRHLTALRDAEVINLDVLPSAEAAALLVRLAGRPGMDPADAAVTAICTLCGYLPLAIGMLARQLHHHPAWTPAGLAADLAAARDRLELLAGENVSVAAGFDLSYAVLDDAQRRLFRRLALHPGPDIDHYAAAALADCPVAAARRGLAGLYDHHLLTEPVAGRYRLHDLLREHARGLAAREDQAGEREQVLGRLLDYYTTTASRAETRLARYARPESDPPAYPAAVPALADSTLALAWARAERANLLACLDLVTQTGQQARIVTLTSALASLLRQDGPWADAIVRHTAAAVAASQSGNWHGQAYALCDLSAVRQLTGDFPAAAQALEVALKLSRELGDRRAQAVVLGHLGMLRRLTGDFPAAAQALEVALRLSRELGDRPGQANALSNLGIVHHLTGDYPGTVRAQEAALGLTRDLGDRLGQTVALLSMASAKLKTGDWEDAARDLEEALKLARSLNNQLLQANALDLLGSVRTRVGDYREATWLLKEALGIFRVLGNQLGRANALTNLGRMHRLHGDYGQAATTIDAAIGVYRDLGNPSGESEALNEAGTLHLDRGAVDQAEACYRRALELARMTGGSWDEAYALAGLGRCARATGRRPEARNLLREAHEIFRRIGAAEATRAAAEFDALTSAQPS